MTAHARRSSRDAWLGAAAFALAAAALVGVAQILVLLTSYGLPSNGVVTAGHALRLIGGLLSTAGFALLGVALRGSFPSRERRWRLGALFLAIAFAATFGVVCITAYSMFFDPEMADGSPSASLVVGLAIQALRYLWLAVASVLIAPLFVTKLDGGSGVEGGRNRRLARISLGFAVVYGVSMLYEIWSGWGFWDFGVSEALSSSGAQLAASIFLFAAALTATAAFLQAARSPQYCSTPPLPRREGLLAIAASLLFLSYALSATWWFPIRDWLEGATWQDKVYYASEAIGSIAGAIAPMCAAIGFWISRRSLLRRVPDEG